MTRREELLELAGKVETGEANSGDVWLMVAPLDEILLAIYGTVGSVRVKDKTNTDPEWQRDFALEREYAPKEAPPYLTSLDAAQKLHDEVLPGWAYGYDNLNDENCAYVRIDNTLIEVTAKHSIPAAWVSCILRALASMEEDHD